jgi:hypothetical protein
VSTDSEVFEMLKKITTALYWEEYNFWSGGHYTGSLPFEDFCSKRLKEAEQFILERDPTFNIAS